MGTIRGFKVTDSERRLRVGIAAKNLEDLKKKTIDKFKLKLNEGQLQFQTPDGTMVESNDYFNTLESQTLLIWVKKGERADTDAEILYRTIREVNEEYLTAGEKVQEFFTEKMKNKVFKLAEVLKGIDPNKTNFSKRDDHPEWFEGLDTRSKTKEEYMFRRSQDRIRTYYYKTKDELLKKELPPSKLQELLKNLQQRLKEVDYFGFYFDRRCPQKSICDEEGTFVCQGRWDRDRCMYNLIHKINPYTSKEERVVFQTWNMDHSIERSRAIIPAICDALEEDDTANGKTKKQLDADRIFDDLFTLNNLKIVHIVCHDKGVHACKKAGPYLISF